MNNEVFLPLDTKCNIDTQWHYYQTLVLLTQQILILWGPSGPSRQMDAVYGIHVHLWLVYVQINGRDGVSSCLQGAQQPQLAGLDAEQINTEDLRAAPCINVIMKLCSLLLAWIYVWDFVFLNFLIKHITKWINIQGLMVRGNGKCNIVIMWSRRKQIDVCLWSSNWFM